MLAELRKLFGIQGRVGRAEYAVAGVLLLLIKYAVDALVFYLVLGAWWHPLDYLNPVYAQRMSAAPPLEQIAPAFGVFLLLWGLLFAWIGTAMSVRRAVDAGYSAWSGLLFFLPLFNYLLISVLVLTPSSKQPPPAAVGEPRVEARRVGQVVMTGIGVFAVAVLFYGLVIHGTANYGKVAFCALPLTFGLGLGFLMNRGRPGTLQRTLSFATLSFVVACLGLLLFAFEGILCIAMAAPLVLPLICVGAILGRGIAITGAEPSARSLCLVLALPLSAWLDSKLESTPPREVSSFLEIAAPPSVVWEHVVAFAELPEPEDWLFGTGLAYPMRARIEGTGVGAVRYCEFSTGPFIEPITLWEEPNRLGFDVIEQPIPMQEWSFYDDVRPPHLTQTFRSVRGEFRLIELPGGRTRLEGSTWYELDMAPEVYWRVWADGVIHRIHLRVLRHVKALSE